MPVGERACWAVLLGQWLVVRPAWSPLGSLVTVLGECDLHRSRCRPTLHDHDHLVWSGGGSGFLSLPGQQLVPTPMVFMPFVRLVGALTGNSPFLVLHLTFRLGVRWLACPCLVTGPVALRSWCMFAAVLTSWPLFHRDLLW